MKLILAVFFSTFVISIAAFSSPHEPSPETESVSPPIDNSQRKQAEKDLGTFTVAPKQKEISGTKEKFYFPHTQSISPRLGAGYFFTLPSDPPEADADIIYLFGIQYMMKSVTNRHWELGIDVATESRAYLNLGLKWLTQTEKFRPFWKLGIAQRWDRADGLESLVDYKSYSARATIGFEWLVMQPASLRMDLDAQIGLDETTVILTLGYSWPW